MTWWHLHRWSRWRNFTYVTYEEEQHGSYTVVYGVCEAMQEKTCRKCGNTRQRKVGYVLPPG